MSTPFAFCFLLFTFWTCSQPPHNTSLQPPRTPSTISSAVRTSSESRDKQNDISGSMWLFTWRSLGNDCDHRPAFKYLMHRTLRPSRLTSYSERARKFSTICKLNKQQLLKPHSHQWQYCQDADCTRSLLDETLVSRKIIAFRVSEHCNRTSGYHRLGRALQFSRG